MFTICGRQRPVVQEVAVERLALQQLHRDERLALLLADLVNRADVRVIERRGRSRLEPEPLGGLWAALQIGGQELQRDTPAKREIFGLVHDAHPARSDARRIR